jgi:hypothetical protein
LEKKLNINKKGVIISLLLILTGIGWLLTINNVMENVNWVWPIFLFSVGVISLGFYGINKVNFSIGTVFIISSATSILRQNGKITFQLEIPILLIFLGIFMLISFLINLKTPDIFKK